MNRHQQYPYPELKPTSSQNTGDDDSADEIEVVHTVHNNSAAKAVHNTDNVNSTLASFCWNKACVRCILPLFIICGITYGVIAALGIHVDKNSIPFSDFIFSRDGWEGLKAEDLPRWNNRGSGILQVEMLNALDDHWQSYFNKSFDEWNSGEPSVLELSVTKVEPDSGCDFVGGKFAVCNGDYGDNTFHGVNEILVFGGSITASVAKLNEYYMKSATEARKQYTMCHEIGHGFGLPHSDENFYNLNLGNCMDYTDRPWTNTAPDTETFELLQEIYGNPDLPTPSGATDGVISTASTSTSNSFFRGNGNEGGDDSDIPDSIRQRAHEAAHNLETKFADDDADEDWVQLHRDDRTAAFQIELGAGYDLQAHFLLAAPSVQPAAIVGSSHLDHIIRPVPLAPEP